MIELKSILLPTDFSQFSEPAKGFACALAERFEAELHVLHVLETYPSAAPDFGMGLAVTHQVEESADEAREALAGALDAEWQKNHSVVLATAKGSAFVEIIRYAKENNIGMIVMGTHGRSGLAHVLLGSVAERVVRKAPCPVLTIRHEAHEFSMP